MLTEADNEIKNMKVRYATGKIDEEIYEVAIKEMQNRKDILTLEIEKCNDNLSNLETQIPAIISTACKLGTLWHDGDLETKRKIQNLVYPNGIYWDKAKRCYRTQNRNKFFDILDRYSISYDKEKGTSSDEDVPLCGRRESNPYAARHQILSLACLPISTRPLFHLPFRKGLQMYDNLSDLQKKLANDVIALRNKGNQSGYDSTDHISDESRSQHH